MEDFWELNELFVRIDALTDTIADALLLLETANPEKSYLCGSMLILTELHGEFKEKLNTAADNKKVVCEQ